MGITLKKQFTSPAELNAGPITIVATAAGHGVNPLAVQFDVDLSSASFDVTSEYDPVLDTTFTGPHDPRYNRLDVVWSFGETGRFPLVEDWIPAEYSFKDRGLGLRTSHVFTDAAMTAAGTTYTVRVLVKEPSSGKQATFTTTVTVKNYLYEASKIVCVNNTGDTDFTAFDATEDLLIAEGWTGTRVNVNLAGAQFTEADAAFSAHSPDDNVVWLLKGNGEVGAPEYDVVLNIPDTVGANPIFGAYGSGRAQITRTGRAKMFDLNSVTSNSCIIRDWVLTGDFDPLTDVPLEKQDIEYSGAYWFEIRPGWWLTMSNCKVDGQGPGVGIWNMGSGTTARLSLCEVEMANAGSEYAFIAGANVGTLDAIGCLFLDPPNRLMKINRMAYTGKTGSLVAGETLTGGTSGATAEILKDEDIGGGEGVVYLKTITGTYQINETLTATSGSATNLPNNTNPLQTSGNSDIRNSHIRLSNVGNLHISKTRMFLARREAGQYNFKLGNGGASGGHGNIYFNVHEGGQSLMGLNPAGSNSFSEYLSFRAQCCVCIGMPYTQAIGSIAGDGCRFENILWWIPAWSTDVSQGDNTLRPRYLLNISTDSTDPAWVGAPVEIEGVTTICDLTSTQNGASLRDIGDNNIANASARTDHPLIPFVATDCITHAPNQDTVLTSASPLQATAGVDTVLTALGNPISPLWGGVNEYDVYDQTTDISAKTMPSARLQVSSSALKSNTTPQLTFDYLARRRGPTWSDGAAEDVNDENIEPGWPV